MAYGEFTIFLFMPIVMLGVQNIIEKDYKKGILYFTIGYTGMIYSHLVLTVYFTIFVTLILIIHYKEILKLKTIGAFALATILTLCITMEFIAPMLEHKTNGDYVVFEEGSMTSIGHLDRNKLELSKLINGNIHYKVFVYINIITIILATISLFTYEKNLQNNREKKICFSYIIIAAISIFMVSELMNWNLVPKLLWNIQFPWRLCSFMSFSLSIISGIAILNFSKEKQKILIIITAILCLYSANTLANKCKLQKLSKVDEEDASSVTTGAMGWQREYLPVKSRINLEYIKNRTQDIIIKNGNADIYVIENEDLNIKFKIENIQNDEKLVLEIPRIYYLGYSIKYNNNGKTEILKYYENDMGMIEFEVSGNGEIQVSYEGTTINKIANAVSVVGFITLLALGGVVIFEKHKGNSKHKN